MFSYINVTAKGLLLILLPLVCELIFVAALANQLKVTADEFNRLQNSQKILFALHSTAAKGIRASATFLGFENSTMEERVKAEKEIEAMTLREGYFGDLNLELSPGLKDLFEESDENRKHLAKLLHQIGTTTQNNQSIQTLPRKDRDEMILSLVISKSMTDRIKQEATRLDETAPEELRGMFAQLMVFLIAGLALSCAMSFLLAYVLTFDIVRRLKTIGDNAYLLAAGKDLPEPQTGGDEIADLDRLLNETSRQLQAFHKKELAILNNAADVVCSLDKQLRFRAIGASAERIWGYSIDHLMGRSMLTILAGDTAEDIKAKFDKNDADIVTSIVLKDGAVKDFLWTVSLSSEEEVFFCVAQDITEIRKLEKLKQAFFSMVSHDLRTPLASINVNIANMKGGVCGTVPQEARKLLDTAAASMDRLTALVNDLLELDKLESGKLILEKECISLREVCDAAIDTIDSMAAGAGVTIVRPTHDAAVMADERRLVQAVTNLISNAIKFSPRGSKVTVEINRRNGMVEIDVTDQGPGIPEEQSGALFDKYTQGAAISNIAVKGTGLGLAIVKSIAAAHQGEVGVDSKVGQGSTFWIRLKEFLEEGEH